ncbi:MAG: hypothetical protein K0S09_3113 [Sphingobacteriaceae bacterium]|jgi:hypothetical protein|nr:hypothetical protein [Sphingobacteriaceae bacterium]
MQPMSDKELDKLFQAEFDSFEVEPSAGLWERIDEELGSAPAQEKKKAFPVFWMAAASVVVVMTAGIYFLQPTEKIQLRGKQSQIADTEPAVKEIKRSPVDVKPVQEQYEQKHQAPASSATLVAINEKREAVHQLASTEPKEEASTQLVEENARMAGSTLAVNTPEVSPVSQPEKAVMSSLRSNQQPSLVAMLSPEVKEANEVEQTSPRQKIKSLGDLVNRVVAKVDPREEKIIQFTDNDEGTEVSGINLGLIKFKHNHNANK